MNVVNLADFSNRETRAVLRGLADLATAGQLAGLAVVYQLPDGRDRAIFTGPYRRSGAASRAGFLLQLEDLAPPAPPIPFE